MDTFSFRAFFPHSVFRLSTLCVLFFCVSLFNHFYLHPSSLLLPPPSIHPSTGHAFINSKMIFFFPQPPHPHVSWTRASLLWHVFFLHLFLLICPSSFPWWDCHYGSWCLWSDRMATPTSLTAWAAALSWRFSRGLLVCSQHVFCFVTVCEHSVTSYHRAIWDAEQRLH